MLDIAVLYHYTSLVPFYISHAQIVITVSLQTNRENQKLNRPHSCTHGDGRYLSDNIPHVSATCHPHYHYRWPLHPLICTNLFPTTPFPCLFRLSQIHMNIEQTEINFRMQKRLPKLFGHAICNAYRTHTIIAALAPCLH